MLKVPWNTGMSSWIIRMCASGLVESLFRVEVVKNVPEIVSLIDGGPGIGTSSFLRAFKICWASRPASSKSRTHLYSPCAIQFKWCITI